MLFCLPPKFARKVQCKGAIPAGTLNPAGFHPDLMCLGSGPGWLAWPTLIFSPCLGLFVGSTHSSILCFPRVWNDNVSISSVKSSTHWVCLVLSLKCKVKCRFSFFFFPSFILSIHFSLCAFSFFGCLFSVFLPTSFSLSFTFYVFFPICMYTHVCRDANICIYSSFTFGSEDLALSLLILIFLATSALSIRTVSGNLSPQGRLLSQHHLQPGWLDSRSCKGFSGEIKKPGTRAHRTWTECSKVVTVRERSLMPQLPPKTWESSCY